MTLTAGLVVYPLASAVSYRRLLAVMAVGAALTLLGGVAFRAPGAVAWAIAVLIADYGLSLAGRSNLDPGAPLVAVAAVLLGEVAMALIGEPRRHSPARLRREARRVAVTAMAAGGSAAAVLGVVALVGPGGPLLQLTGLVAAAAGLALLTELVALRR